MSLKYEPSSEPLGISAKQRTENRWRAVIEEEGKSDEEHPDEDSFLLSSLELSDTQVYEPKIASHCCDVVVLNSRIADGGL